MGSEVARGGWKAQGLEEVSQGWRESSEMTQDTAILEDQDQHAEKGELRDEGPSGDR